MKQQTLIDATLEGIARLSRAATVRVSPTALVSLPSSAMPVVLASLAHGRTLATAIVDAQRSEARIARLTEAHARSEWTPTVPAATFSTDDGDC